MLNYMKNRLLQSRGHGHLLWGFFSLSCPHGHVSASSWQSSPQTPGPSSPVLPILGHIHVPGMSQAFPLSPPTKATSDLVELTMSDLEDINMHSHQEGPSL